MDISQTSHLGGLEAECGNCIEQLKLSHVWVRPAGLSVVASQEAVLGSGNYTEQLHLDTSRLSDLLGLLEVGPVYQVSFGSE